MRNRDKPAYPVAAAVIGQETSVSPGDLIGGLTKLEYFTAAALTGLCANSKLLAEGLIASISIDIAEHAIAEINRRK